MITLNIDLSNSEIIQAALSSPNTRIPIWKESTDNIIGVLHIRDLLRALYDNGNDHAKISIPKLLSQPWFIPDNALVIQQLHAFKERKNHLACVVDEYGDLQGIITLEDILEEIVGQIHDEYDRTGEAIIKKSDVEYIVDGATTIRDLNRELNWELPDDDANTIAGLIIHKIARIPNQGESIEISNLKIVVVKKIANRIHTVKIKILAPHDNSGD
jgi:Mg2+/Co2+ transporter CorB